MPAGASRGKGRVFRPGPGRRFQDFISLFSPNPENLQVFSKPRPLPILTQNPQILRES